MVVSESPTIAIKIVGLMPDLIGRTSNIWDLTSLRNGNSSVNNKMKTTMKASLFILRKCGFLGLINERNN